MISRRFWTGPHTHRIWIWTGLKKMSLPQPLSESDKSLQSKANFGRLSILLTGAIASRDSPMFVKQVDLHGVMQRLSISGKQAHPSIYNIGQPWPFCRVTCSRFAAQILMWILASFSHIQSDPVRWRLHHVPHPVMSCNLQFHRLSAQPQRCSSLLPPS